MAMIQARGGRLSKTAEKLFSSTEGLRKRLQRLCAEDLTVQQRTVRKSELEAMGNGSRRIKGLPKEAQQRWLS